MERTSVKLVSAKVGPFKSINNPQDVSIDPEVTVFVGMNEAGKTVFLQALHKSVDALKLAKFDPVDDYPRKNLSAYLKRHKDNPDTVTVLTYEITQAEADDVNKQIGTTLKAGFTFTVSHSYANTLSIGCHVDEKPMIAALVKQATLSSDASKAIKGASSLKEIPDRLKDVSLTEQDQVFLKSVTARVSKAKWQSVGDWEAWQHFSPKTPKLVYFSDYDLLPSKMNLADLSNRVAQAKTNGNQGQLTAQHRATLALLRMADISVDDFTASTGYEPLKAKIEGVSISLTDQIMEFWKQNEDLEVEVDIKPDPSDQAPFNNGPNLYLRIKNRRHRGVSTPFEQRSRGFIWFFSFLVWFDSVQHQLAIDNVEKIDLILLLDEPGLALHAMAQRDFLRYCDI